MKRLIVFIGFLVLGSLAVPSRTFADWRYYVWTYQYQTMRRNTWELENYLTFEVPYWGESNTNSIEEQFEIEYGITDHWDIAVYNSFQRANVARGDDKIFYKGFKIRTRYRFGEKGKYPIDPLLYFEWVRDVERDKNPNKFEGKVILGKDIGKFNISYNQILESRLGSGGRTEHGFAMGASYEIYKNLRMGIEAKGLYHHPGKAKEKFALGPTLSWACRYFWVTAGLALGANEPADDFEARILIGLPF